MPDFLDSLIGQVKETSPTLRPRTPGLFEPTPSRSGVGFPAGERFSIPRDSSPDDTLDSLPADRGSAQLTQPAARSPSGRRPAALLGEPQASYSAGEPSWARQDMPLQADHEQIGPHPSQTDPRAALAPPTDLRSRLNNLEGLTRGAGPAAPRPAAQLITAAGRSRQPILPLEDEPAPLRRQGETFTAPTPPRQVSSPVQSEDGSFAPSSSASQAGRASSLRGEQSLMALSAEIEALRRQEAGENTASPALSAASPVALPFRPPDVLSTRARERPPQPGESLARGEAPLLVYVSIGRVEVRAAPVPSPTLSQRTVARGAAPTSLEDYLRRMNGGAR